MVFSSLWTRRQIGAALGGLVVGASQAQTFFNSGLTLMVPYPAGGLSDALARCVSPALSRHLKRPVVVENLGGVSGALAAQKVLNAPANGQLLFQGSPNELILSPWVNPAVKYNSEDFRMVQGLATSALAFLARPDLPANGVDTFIHYAHQRAELGQPITYASVGHGSLYHLLGAHLAQRLGVAMTHVPYRGGALAEQDLLGRRIDIFLTPYSKKYDDHHKVGHLKILVLLNSQRVEGLLHLPAIGESKALANFVFTTWSGFFVKASTPESVVVTLHQALTAALADPAVVDGLALNSQRVSKILSLREAQQVYADHIAQFRGLAQAIS